VVSFLIFSLEVEWGMAICLLDDAVPLRQLAQINMVTSLKDIIPRAMRFWGLADNSDVGLAVCA
jgi:hypothetical protein